jgi:hypothetical protein
VYILTPRASIKNPSNPSSTVKFESVINNALLITSGGGSIVTIGVKVYPSPGLLIVIDLIVPPAPITGVNVAVIVGGGGLNVICGWNV